MGVIRTTLNHNLFLNAATDCIACSFLVTKLVFWKEEVINFGIETNEGQAEIFCNSFHSICRLFRSNISLKNIFCKRRIHDSPIAYRKVSCSWIMVSVQNSFYRGIALQGCITLYSDQKNRSCKSRSFFFFYFRSIALDECRRVGKPYTNDHCLHFYFRHGSFTGLFLCKDIFFAYPICDTLRLESYTELYFSRHRNRESYFHISSTAAGCYNFLFGIFYNAFAVKNMCASFWRVNYKTA